MLARENPHCGVSGVPFMNKTTGLDSTALSIAVRVSVESSRKVVGASRTECCFEKLLRIELLDNGEVRRKIWIVSRQQLDESHGR